MADQLQIEARCKHFPEESNVPALDTGKFKVKFDMSSSEFVHTTQTLTTTNAELNIYSEMTAANVGYLLIYNEDDTNSAIIGFDDVSTPKDAMPIRIKTNRFVLFDAQGAGGKIFGVASSATVDIVIYAFYVE